MADQRVQSKRLDGLDFARFLAFFGMVLVNFKVAAGATNEGAIPWLATFHESLEGRAAALFVLLAGVGIGLSANRISAGQSLWPVQQTILIRGNILFAFGMLNLIIFEADILHYYGLYFLFAVFFLSFSIRGLLASAAILVLIFPIMAVLVDYDQGWNWDTLVYSGFWTVSGFLRHSFINGWHPVLPWLAFLLVGMAVARLDLPSQKVRGALIGGGGALMASAWLIATGLNLSVASLVVEDPEIADLMLILVSPTPIPPAPVYMMTATGSALIMLSVSLWLGDQSWLRAILSPAVATGRQALTLYIAHILIGMGTMELIGWVAVDASSGAANLQQATVAAVLFTLAAMIYASLWQKWLGQGPLERLLRVLSK